jgi:cell wall-associated NlpC family hydrolase
VSTPSRARARVSALVLVAAATLGVAATTTPAQAATTSTTYQASVVHEAARHAGAPYQYGAAGPSRFDCSGLTRYVFAHFHKSLPHSAAQQYTSIRHITRSQMRAGDLLFFRNSSGRISHVAIYAGGNTMWHAPHSGTVVKHVQVYSNDYVVGRP